MHRRSLPNFASPLTRPLPTRLPSHEQWAPVQGEPLPPYTVNSALTQLANQMPNRVPLTKTKRDSMALPSISSRRNGQRWQSLGGHRGEAIGKLIRGKAELGQMLKRAQLAILNPSVPMEQFVDINPDNLEFKNPPFDSGDRLPFSSNVVCVTVWGPDVPDLFFIDLPGEQCIIACVLLQCRKHLLRCNSE